MNGPESLIRGVIEKENDGVMGSMMMRTYKERGFHLIRMVGGWSSRNRVSGEEAMAVLVYYPSDGHTHQDNERWRNVMFLTTTCAVVDMSNCEGDTAEFTVVGRSASVFSLHPHSFFFPSLTLV